MILKGRAAHSSGRPPNTSYSRQRKHVRDASAMAALVADSQTEAAVAAAVAASDGVGLAAATVEAQEEEEEEEEETAPVASRASRLRWSLRRVSLSRSQSRREEPYVAPTEQLLFLEVRPVVFAAIWWGMVVVHTFTAVLLSMQARLYVYLTDPRMSFFVNLVEPDIGSKYKAVAAVFGLLSAFHWRTVFMLVSTSIRQRKYAFFPANHYEMTPFVKPSPSERRQRWWRRIIARISAARLAIWGRRGVLGVESKYFYPYFYLREFIELTSQIWQAYRGSLLVSRPWINHLSVSIIVINCWLTPAFQVGYKQRPEVRRIAILALDATLDFLTAIVVPLSIFFPYFLEFNHLTRTFPLEKTYDEKWFVNGVLENQEFLIVSVADLVFKCIPHISITGCLKKVRLLLRKDTSVRVNGMKPVYATVVTPTARRELAQAKMDHIRQKADQAKADSTRRKAIARVVKPQHRQTLSRYVRKYANKLVRAAFVLVGSGVLGIHLRGIWTSHKANKVGCKQEMRPWFAPGFACSIFDVDCQRLNITGSEAEIRQILTPLYAPAVAALVFTHCPALEMPAEIQAFKHLMRIDVYNSSITRWGAEAALTSSYHPSLAILTFARVQFPGGELPDGLVTSSFPDSLRNVEITNSNLARLPEDLHERWHHSMNRVFIEHSNLTHVPLTFYFLETEKLSLEGNAIASLDSAWLMDHEHHYLTLGLSCNPQLTELPSAIHPDSSIRSLRLHRTNVSALPDWITTGDHRVQELEHVFVSRTPLCQALTDPSTVTDGASLAMANLVSCAQNDLADDVSRSVCGLYPLNAVDLKRSQLTSSTVAP